MKGISWPALPSRQGALLLSLLDQLQQGEWLPAKEVERRQYAQASSLASYAASAVPFYRERLEAAGIPLRRRLTPELWRQIPVLTREDIQTQGKALAGDPYPQAHGAVASITTSGSTGKPVTVFSSDVAQLFWSAITLRDHVWHRRDLSGKLVAIRKIKGLQPSEPQVMRFENWGAPAALAMHTGPSASISIDLGAEEQLRLLQEERPAYLNCYPTNLRVLLDLCVREGIRMPGLRQIRTMAEILPSELRAECREVLGVDIADTYSSQECGYLALQCPGYDHFLVQAEVVLLEVLKDDGEPCGVGETGRVVVTPLTNFATPLLRYDIGDYATVGGPSPCGRGLPVLQRILGRVRNMLVKPDGQRIWPTFGTTDLITLAPIRQFQFVQRNRTSIEARFVLHRPLQGNEEARLREHLRNCLPEGMEAMLVFVDHIARSEGGKYEDFVCMVRD